MIQREEGGAVPITATHLFVVYVELQEPGPSVELIETKISDGLVFVEGVGNVQTHYLATAELIEQELSGTDG